MADTKNNVIDNAVAEAGAYDVIRKRLDQQGERLKQHVTALNDARLAEFGGVEMSAIGRTRHRTENNCVPRDIVQVGGKLFFGYNVFIGLKKETRVEDVFALLELRENEDGFELKPFDLNESFLNDSRFKGDFEELYRYYKEARLVKLTIKDSKLLAGFQVGERTSDLRVFRWSVSADGSNLQYLDNRGERDIELPNQYDFEWKECSRDDFVHGKHPHVNIADKVFVETIGGDLTVKVENNTEDGLGIYAEAVDDPDQSLDDGQVSYALVGNLVLLAIKPYKEEVTRYLVFNSLTEEVKRIDSIGFSCVKLPEDHGIIFPGGIYLETGVTKAFSDDVSGLQFKRMIRSPNGEDVLYVFYEPVEGRFALFSYNLITKTTQNPIYSNGYALPEDGKLVVFSAEEEPTRVHPMQIWQTSYVSSDFASKQPESTTELGKIGNSELVRGVSDLYAIHRLIADSEVSMRHYEELNSAAKKIFDSHYWLENPSNNEMATTLRDVSATAELVIDEFEKVQSIQEKSSIALAEAKSVQRNLVSKANSTIGESAEQFIAAIFDLRKQRGHLATIKTYRYIDVEQLDLMDQELEAAEDTLGAQTVDFLAGESSLDSYHQRATEYAESIEQASTNAEVKPIVEKLATTAQQLDLLSELITTLQIEDTTVRTRIVDTVSEVYAKLNQTKARGSQKQQGLGSEEAIAQFSAQFKLFSQSITNSLGLADTPEKCDEQLAKLLVQLEDLESQFSEFDQFLADIMEKREEVYESFETHKQNLAEASQRRAQTLSDSAGRMLKSMENRSLKLSDNDELNTYFASDALVLKTAELIEQLRALNAEVLADDIDSRFRSIKEQAIRSLRDKTDIFEDGGKVIKLGPKHKFSVNQQELDLTIIPRDEKLFFHLIGTDYYELVADPLLAKAVDYWSMSLESESSTVYRGEYLAYQVLLAAQGESKGFSYKHLTKICSRPAELTKLVREFSTPLYKQGYQKGVHDHDAAQLLLQILPALDRAGLLMFDAKARGIGQLVLANLALVVEDSKSLIQQWRQRAVSAIQLRNLFADSEALKLVGLEIEAKIREFADQFEFAIGQTDILAAADYLSEQLAVSSDSFVQSRYAKELLYEFENSITDDARASFDHSVDGLTGNPNQQWKLAHGWLNALIKSKELFSLSKYVPEAAANLVTNLELSDSSAELELHVVDLLGEHKKINAQSLRFGLDDYFRSMKIHHEETVPAYHQYLDVRSQVMQRERAAMKLGSFVARPLSSFVRNRLVNESYLPIIGDNLAKQIGTLGDSKRTDLMGLLMMISPPGYGKTTLMEYVANRLGLIFMKINCPALGHEVLSLDPKQAPNSTARQELEKINLAFEMGNNVMLYLDDIQHTNPEFLQQYISLCDGTRRVEGVWKGEPKSYDMRGKKFCVVMAGNPYTESGEVFKVPDMLANRADIYNLGDILGGMEEQFSLSYVENALTSNAILAPLATRDMADVYNFIAMARGENIATTELVHQYSGAEINEIVAVLQKLFVIQELILKVNQQYIASAAQDDRYRTEPPFKLQGSYRNMNKMAEKVSAVMNEDELIQLIDDHYLGESQLLTSGTEENILKLGELRDSLDSSQKQRWAEIKANFSRANAIGGDNTDVGTKVANQIFGLTEGLAEIQQAIAVRDEKYRANSKQGHELEIRRLQSQQVQIDEVVSSLAEIAAAFSKQAPPSVEVVSQPSDEIIQTLDTLAQSMETSIKPLILSMEKKMDIDLRTLEKITDVSNRINNLKERVVDQPPKPVRKKSKKVKKVLDKESSDSKRF